jgi:hypothetical protein
MAGLNIDQFSGCGKDKAVSTFFHQAWLVFDLDLIQQVKLNA